MEIPAPATVIWLLHRRQASERLIKWASMSSMNLQASARSCVLMAKSVERSLMLGCFCSILSAYSRMIGRARGQSRTCGHRFFSVSFSIFPLFCTSATVGNIWGVGSGSLSTSEPT